MSVWFLIFIILAILTLLNLVLLFVPLPSFLRTKIIRRLDSAKLIFLGLLALFVVLSLSTYMDTQKYSVEKEKQDMNTKLFTQVKEFRSQRNFYMSMIGVVLSLITLGVNMKEKKIIDLEDKVQLKQRENKEVESSKDK